MKDIIRDLGIFRREFRDKQTVSDEIQTKISHPKEELPTSIEKVI